MALPRPKSVAVIGLGYFSQFHLAAWRANARANLIGVNDIDAGLTAETAQEFGVTAFGGFDHVLASDPDILDLVVPPPAHATLIRQSLRPGRIVICQKPFCRSLKEAQAVTAEAEAAGTTLVIHENFRFQPWHRTIQRFLADGGLGQVYSARFALRPGDGRGVDAYLARQPTFQRMERFLVQETAVHFIDTFRWMFGAITSVYADLRQLNPVIAGEDAGVLIFDHDSGAQTVFDGNRLSDHVADNPRRTMGELVIEGERGQLSLDGAGQVWHRAFGAQTVMPVAVTDPVDDTKFGGGCVAALIDHVVEASLDDRLPENTAREYLDVIRVCDAAYLSAKEARRITL